MQVNHEDLAILQFDEPTHSRLSNVDTWVFDLDHTLYLDTVGYFTEGLERMAQFVERVKGVDSKQAYDERDRLFREYGSTLIGLMKENKIVADDYIEFVHNVKAPGIPCHDVVTDFMRHADGKKYIFTNASECHAIRVLEAMGILDLFDGIHAVDHTDFIPKPNKYPYNKLFERFGLKASRCAMFEDTWDNLIMAKELGMLTVQIEHDQDLSDVYQLYRPDICASRIEIVLNSILKHQNKNLLTG